MIGDNPSGELREKEGITELSQVWPSLSPDHELKIWAIFYFIFLRISLSIEFVSFEGVLTTCRKGRIATHDLKFS